MFAEALGRLRPLAPRLAAALEPSDICQTWAGLRTFSADGVPVVGEDPARPGFFWLAGQGGCGIETSAVLAQVAADLLIDGRTDRFDASLLAPSRFS